MTTAFYLIFLLLRPSLSEDTVFSVETNLGSHQMQRLVDLLTVYECEQLLMSLSTPEEHLSKETNQFRSMSHTSRDTDKDSHCHPTLVEWLQTHGEQVYYDRLSRTLQQIGRIDIAIEMRKNINQDKTLAMQHYVEEYHERVNVMASQLTRWNSEKTSHREKQHSAKQVRSLSWKDLDLVVEQESMPPYQRHMLSGAWPLLYGLILGVCALLLGVPLLFFILHTFLCDLSGQS